MADGPSAERAHPFDQLIFGNKIPETNESLIENLQQKAVSGLDEIDVDELFGHLDSLVETFAYFKPLIKKIGPYLESFIQQDDK
ncbi:hypothetical protein [Falsibacillus pallidus]|uniref:hypothetical protein n=1 Tax=Falsibacillus pallidus TaxID=493781 RepID=UPI003D95EA7A